MTEEKSEEGRRSVIYARVSTDDKGQTTDAQIRLCKQFCASKGHEVVGVYTDEESGSTLDRPGFASMISRISLKRDVDYLVVYDQSRLTRGEDFDLIRDTLKPYRCYIRFASMDIDLDSMAGRVTTGVGTPINSFDNKIRNEKTHLTMNNKTLQGFHMGRPAKFMFTEDVPYAPKGRCVQGTTILSTEDYIFSFARKGCSIPFVAKRILSIGINTLKREMMPCVWEYTGEQPYARPDRLSAYRAILEGAENGPDSRPKGTPSERVGKADENPSERVVA